MSFHLANPSRTPSVLVLVQQASPSLRLRRPSAKNSYWPEDQLQMSHMAVSLTAPLSQRMCRSWMAADHEAWECGKPGHRDQLLHCCRCPCPSHLVSATSPASLTPTVIIQNPPHANVAARSEQDAQQRVLQSHSGSGSCQETN